MWAATETSVGLNKKVPMGKIVLDTNIFYSWINLSVNDKIPPHIIDNLAESNELFITTASIAEMIVKFRNDLSLLKQCLKPIVESKITIVSIGFIPISNTIIKTIHSADSLDSIESEIGEVFDLKVTKEAELLRFFVIALLYGFFHAIRIIENYKLSEKRNDDAFLLSTRALLEGNSELVFDAMKIELLKGYETGNEQHQIRDALSEWTFRLLNIWIFNFYQAKHGLLFEDLKNPDPEKLAKVNESCKNDAFFTKIEKHKDNLFSLVSNKKYHIHSEDYLNELKKDLTGNDLFSNEARDYIIFKLQKSMIYGAKINKNDVIDLLILYSVMLDGHMFLTLDNKFNNAIKEVSPDSFELAVSLGLTS